MEYLTNDLVVFCKGFGEDEDIVNVNQHLSSENQVPKDVVHHGLKGRRGISKTEEHDMWFKKSSIGTECRFPLITFFNPNIVVPPANIEFSEILGPFEFIDELGNKREGILIFYSDFI